ncbi:hypothetical protein MMC30_004313 [Trapelia coarctata]|nr:hypothetical protein [Trapelia coarctata]
MVSIQTVRASNAKLKELGPGLVAVFASSPAVGGTSGIGETTAREFVRHTLSPHVYLVGRNQTQAKSIISELEAINSDGKISFIQSDVSLLRNVDTVCRELKAKEPKINLLFMSAGILTLKGRDETPEGLDKKFSLHYYSRARFATNLLPLLAAASSSSAPGNLSRVISVLSAGTEGKMNLDDLSLKTHYSLANCANHAVTMNSLLACHQATTNPTTSFIHAAPGFVNTGLGTAGQTGMLFKAAMGVVSFVISPLAVPLQESGERHLYAATSEVYKPSGTKGGEGDVLGKGAYLLNWGGERTEKKILGEYRAQGVEEKVWEHTSEVFEKICGEGGGKYDG